jgi:hypothetical protein
LLDSSLLEAVVLFLIDDLVEGSLDFFLNSDTETWFILGGKYFAF